MHNPTPEFLRELIAWGKTLCLPHRSDVEWNVWQLAMALEHAVTPSRSLSDRGLSAAEALEGNRTEENPPPMEIDR